MNTNHNRPGIARLLAAAMTVGALLIGCLGLSAYGYLVPAVVALAVAALVWRGQLGGLVRWVVLISLVSSTVLVLDLALGDGLGSAKLNISAVALLVNLLAGGPVTALVAMPLLRAMRAGQPLASWFAGREA